MQLAESIKSAVSVAPTRRVLIVDDDDAIRSVICLVLSDEGFEVIEAADGAIALERVQEYPPSLILLDMRMPVMDGWQFATAYRELPSPHAPIITMTAAVDARQWASEIGAQGVLEKPFDVDELISTVEQFVTV